jgi:NAD(P)-dependent dehydrogenase (short-subunit alcohol dehydrogenase family)
MEPLKQLGRWSDAELNAAVVSGLMATFIKMDPEAFDSLYDEDAQGAIIDSASKWSGEMESGKAINLMPGESIESPTPGRPNPAFDPFWTAMVRQIGMALEMPFEVLVMHFQSSYSAARAALLMAWKAFRAKRDLLAKTLCQPVFELWLADEVAQGRINAPGFFADDITRAAWCAAIWTGDGPGSIDPAKEVTAAKMRVELGISTKQAESIAHDGVDWAQKHEQRVKEINAEKADGIYIAPAGSPVPPGQGAGPTEDGAPVPPDAPAKDDGKDDGTADALAQINTRLQDIEARPPVNVTVHTPDVTVNQGDINVHPAQTTVNQGAHHTHLPEGMVTLDAHIAAPIINVDVPPAQIVVQAAPKVAMQQVHKRDADGNLVETITTPLA